MDTTNNKCIECKQAPIYIKKRKLCKSCYWKFIRTKKTPYTKTKKEKFIRSISIKYGDEILKDIEEVMTLPYYTLSSLAQKYDFSREYARIIYKKIYGEPYTKRIKAKQDIIHADNTVCKNHPNRKTADYKKASTRFNNAYASKKFIEKCNDLGLDVTIPGDKYWGIIVNGYLISVMSASIARYYNQAAKTKYYVFDNRPPKSKECDFIVCYLSGKNLFYIIPKQPNRKIYIPFKKSYHTASKNKYDKYKNNFNLLKREA